MLKKCCAHNWQQELIAYLWVMNIIICNTVIIRDRYRSICTFQEYKWKYRVDTRPFRPLVQSVKGRLRQTNRVPEFSHLGQQDIFVGERAKRASHSQVCSIENRGYIYYYYYILEKWFPLWGERAHSLKLFCMYDKRFEI